MTDYYDEDGLRFADLCDAIMEVLDSDRWISQSDIGRRIRAQGLRMSRGLFISAMNSLVMRRWVARSPKLQSPVRLHRAVPEEHRPWVGTVAEKAEAIIRNGLDHGPLRDRPPRDYDAALQSLQGLAAKSGLEVSRADNHWFVTSDGDEIAEMNRVEDCKWFLMGVRWAKTDQELDNTGDICHDEPEDQPPSHQ